MHYLGYGRCEFTVWAPFQKEVALKIVSPQEKIIPMEKDSKGYWKITVGDTSDKRGNLYKLINGKERPEKLHPKEKESKGYRKKTVGESLDKTRYLYQLNDGKERPDTASHFQPEGVHGPSQVIDHDSFRWEDREWNGIPLCRPEFLWRPNGF